MPAGNIKDPKGEAKEAKGGRSYWLWAMILALAAGGIFKLSKTNILVDLNENQKSGHVMLQALFLGFCLNTDAITELADKSDTASFDVNQKDLNKTDFINEGAIDEDDYTKQSIYSLLYSVYGDLGAVRFHGSFYQFRFNTWGLGGVYDPKTGHKRGAKGRSYPIGEDTNHLTSYPATQPQRHGKTAYSSLLNFNTIKAEMARIEREEGRMVNVVEIGSGTGAGANELTWIHPNLNYTAVEMQARGAQTCRRIHASSEARFTERGPDTRLTCLHANGQDLEKFLPDGFADIVLISETHIADVVPLDLETRNVFDQMKRLLRPGGHFVWGNAIPTSIWGESFRYLKQIGMEKKEIWDVTEQAVLARDEDFDRVVHWYNQVQETYYALKLFPKCRHAVDRLFKNFCRQPGTNLYKRMLINSNATKPAPSDLTWCREDEVPESLCSDRRVDSYVHTVYQKPLEA